MKTKNLERKYIKTKKNITKKIKNSSKNKFLNKLKDGFFIDGHLHLIPKVRLNTFYIHKPDNDYMHYLQSMNYDIIKYKKLIKLTDWKPDGIVPCTIQPTNFFTKIKETDLITEMDRKFILGYQAAIPVHNGKIGVNTFLNSIKKYKNLIKIARILLSHESICENITKNLDPKIFMEGLNELGKHNIIWKWSGDKSHFKFILDLTEKCKNTKFIIDHMLLSSKSKDFLFKEWQKCMLKLSKLKNIVGIDISGLMQIKKTKKINKSYLKVFIKETINIFGYEKIIIGSNWPVDFSLSYKSNNYLTRKNKINTNVVKTYNEIFNIIYECCKELNLSNKAICDIFRNNIITICNLNMKVKYI